MSDNSYYADKRYRLVSPHTGKVMAHMSTLAEAKAVSEGLKRDYKRTNPSSLTRDADYIIEKRVKGGKYEEYKKPERAKRSSSLYKLPSQSQLNRGFKR